MPDNFNISILISTPSSITLPLIPLGSRNVPGFSKYLLVPSTSTNCCHHHSLQSLYLDPTTRFSACGTNLGVILSKSLLFMDTQSPYITFSFPCQNAFFYCLIPKGNSLPGHVTEQTNSGTFSLMQNAFLSELILCSNKSTDVDNFVANR